MHAQLQVSRQAIALHGAFDHAQVVREFPGELFDIAHAIHALVEPPGEFRRDGLKGDFLIGDERQNDQQPGGVRGALVSSMETSVMNVSTPLTAAMRR